MEKYNALIIDPDSTTRMRLKTATTAVPQFGSVQLVNALRDASTRVSSGDRCDVIFVSYKIEQTDMVNFIKEAKATKGGQDSAYVLVLGANNQNNTTVANTVMIGADALLFEPYSVDQLVEITRLSAQVRKDRSGAREKMAYSLLVKDVMRQIDLVAYLKALGHEPETSLKKLRDMLSIVPSLSGDSTSAFMDVLVNLFIEAPLPDSSFRADKYKGVSARVKRKMAEKIIAEVEGNDGKAPATPTEPAS